MDPRLLQISDSQFPVGALAHSFGLETLVAEGWVTKDNFRAYLLAMLKNQAGPCDLVFMLSARRDIGGAAKLSGLYGCHRPVPEFHAASLAMGRRLVRLGFRLTGEPELGALTDKNIHQPVAFGAVCAAMGIPERDAAYGFLYNWAAAATSAAVRLMPLGHDAAQEILYEMHGAIRLAFEENRDRRAEDAWQFTPEAELAGIKHQKMYTRLFLS